MIDWQEITIGDLGKVVTGKTPSTSKPEYYGGSIQFLTPTDMDGRRTINHTLRYLSEKGKNKVRSSLLPKGSVSVSCIGSDMGKTVLLGLKSVTNQQINSIIVKKEFDNLFVYYNLSGRKNELQFLASGAAQPIMNKTDFSNLKIKVPPLIEQKAIVSVLSALDDKIENNLKINEKLEKMAQAIFNSWFIDFDPVHAKAAGNTPLYMDEETTALFPSSFNDEGLPVGWQYKRLDDISDLSWGDLNTTKNSYVETGYDAYSASGKDGKLSYFDYEKLGIVLSAIGANCGKTWLARGKWSCIKNTIRFWSNYDPIPTVFLFHATKGNNFWPIRGSAQPFISQGDARSQKIIVPANGEAVSFERIVGKFYEKINTNENENQTLAVLRDTLLPKLMSGEIRVKDAERETHGAL